MRQRSIRALRRLGMASPLPFIGRDRELAAIARALTDTVAVVVRGPVGSGKTRLATEVAACAEISAEFADIAYIRCEPGERGRAVLARAERRMGILPGSLRRVLAAEARALIVDDIHNLDGRDAARTAAALVPRGADAAGRVLLLSRDDVPLSRTTAAVRFDLDGLDETAARQLWHHLEDSYGPTGHGACDRALVATRAMPLALRREYARASFGDAVWNIEDITGPARAVLDAVAVLRLPAAPAAILTLADEADECATVAQLGATGGPRREELEGALADRVAHQLIDPCADGRFVLHESVRDRVLAAMTGPRRCSLERRAAALIAAMGPSPAERVPGSECDGALGRLGPIDRLREQVAHLLSAGDIAAAAERIAAAHDEPTPTGAGSELLGLIAAVRAAGPGDRPELEAVRASIVARSGRVAEALEIYAAAGSSSEPGPGRGGPFDRVESAEMRFRSGDVIGARAALDQLIAEPDPDQRCRAAAVLTEIELVCGRPAAAESLAAGVFTGDRSVLSEDARGRLHLALAAVEQYLGRLSAARAALSRAASSGHLDLALGALIATRRSACLVHEGRISEAEAALDEAESTAREVACVRVVDEIRRCRSLIAARAGRIAEARGSLAELIAERRQHGDELGALRAEIDLARILAKTGELGRAAELVSACATSTARRQLAGLAAEVRWIGALIDLAELRLKSAEVELCGVRDDPAACVEIRVAAGRQLVLVHALTGRPAPDDDRFDECEIADDLGAALSDAAAALADGDSAAALKAARAVAVRAERAGRAGELAEALALSARLLFARGDRAGASRAAERALREAEVCGLVRARAHALLCCAAIAREEGDPGAAADRVRAVVDLATAAGLPVERLVAAEALDAITDRSSSGTADIRNAAAATLSEEALTVAATILSDLGLTAVRPFRVVSAGGAESFVADANPDHLRLTRRSLAIDAVREVIYRSGEQIADLRRRSLLKRLLFLFASAPGHIYSKEGIVLKVWEVDYHPLRHDAALFTNIMRIRRLLGKDGADLIRVSEDGYRFVPPKDYLYVENACPE